MSHRFLTHAAGAALAARLLLPVAAQAGCLKGYVPRAAADTDRVCVTPATHRRAVEDNRLAFRRMAADGGANGPSTCRQGYVWREAFKGDTVCVPPAVRTQAARDNALAASRQVHYTF